MLVHRKGHENVLAERDGFSTLFIMVGPITLKSPSGLHYLALRGWEALAGPAWQVVAHFEALVDKGVVMVPSDFALFLPSQP